ncbi:MAG TPA: S1 family peptidase [Kribbella sp.]|uniref:S1 family peptidase n=1 Tax=Kribbella sp. TaxID=1871183 RepID=UPI002D795E12|nr:S1 family peptidase [Kribbella sp.]HET6292613.1 S1 family peptidase [Kribbella sp.]
MRSRSVRHVGAVLGLGSLLIGGLLIQSASQAVSVPAALTDPVQASKLATDLGADRTGGAYYDDSGRLVVAVTDQATADAVRRAGGTPQVVSYSTAALNSIHAELDQLPAIPNTSWGVDPSTNRVSVEIYDGVSAADRAQIEAIAAKRGDAVQIEKLPGTLKPTVDLPAGVGITSDWKICTAGFNVQNTNGDKFFLTSGHCVTGGYRTWNKRTGGALLGVATSRWQYGPSDYAVIDYTGPGVVAYGTVFYNSAHHQITGSRYVSDGEPVKRVGTISKDLVGTVLLPSTTVTYQDGTRLDYMIKTSLCAQTGDSGGPLFSGTAALGITSASTTNRACDSNVSDDRTFYEPVQAVLNQYGLKVY